MEIIQVNHLHRPSIGGIENYTYRLSNYLEESGHSTSTITTDASLANTQSPLDRLDDVKYCKTTISLFRNPLSIELYRAVQQSSADIYHLHSPYFFPTLEAAHVLPDETPLVLTIHGFPPSRNLAIQFRNRLYRPLMQYILDQVDMTIVLGASEKRRLLTEFDVAEAAVTVIPNGIHPDQHDVPQSTMAQFRTKYGIDPSTPTLLYVSRLVESKNPDVLLDALTTELSRTDLDVLMIGNGDEKYVADLRSRADDRVHFLSNIPFEDLQAAYHVSDVFVHLSSSEGLPTVILEAMNARLPIICTPVGAIPDTIMNGENGVVLDLPVDPTAVGQAIRSYLENPEIRETVGETNRERVRTTYDWQKIAREIEAVYDEILDQS